MEESLYICHILYIHTYIKIINFEIFINVSMYFDHIDLISFPWLHADLNFNSLDHYHKKHFCKGSNSQLHVLFSFFNLLNLLSVHHELMNIWSFTGVWLDYQAINAQGKLVFLSLETINSQMFLSNRWVSWAPLHFTLDYWLVDHVQISGRVQT